MSITFGPKDKKQKIKTNSLIIIQKLDLIIIAVSRDIEKVSDLITLDSLFRIIKWQLKVKKYNKIYWMK